MACANLLGPGYRHQDKLQLSIMYAVTRFCQPRAWGRVSWRLVNCTPLHANYDRVAYQGGMARLNPFHAVIGRGGTGIVPIETAVASCLLVLALGVFHAR
jgi:hypothetical protein